MRVRLIPIAAVLTAACASPPPVSPALSASTVAVAPASPIVFLEDDYASAETKAKTEGKLVFVDVWAPWCHTCLSMKHGVLDSPVVASHGSGFVFASLDGDKDENAEFLARYPVKVWPTLFAIDPVTRDAVAMYGGSLSATELAGFLDQAQAAHSSSGPDPDLAKALAAAHAAFSSKNLAEAERLYTAAAARPWARRNEALIGAMRAFSAAKDFPACGAFGLAHLRDVSGTSSPADFVDDLRTCAQQSTDLDLKERIESLTLERLRALADQAHEGASVDDRADLLDMLADAEAKAGNKTRARAAEELRVSILEEAATKAGSPEGSRVFDYERMGAYLALGRGEDAVKLFEGRVHDFPDSYEAWARLASTLHAVGRDKDALAAVEKAVTLAYGPRKLRYLGLRAEIQRGLGDLDGAVASLEEEVRGAKALPTGQRDDARIEDAEGRLARAKEARAATKQ